MQFRKLFIRKRMPPNTAVQYTCPWQNTILPKCSLEAQSCNCAHGQESSPRTGGVATSLARDLHGKAISYALLEWRRG